MIRRFIIIIIFDYYSFLESVIIFFRAPDGPPLSQKELRRGCVVVAFGSVRPSVCLAGFVSALWKER